jgi:outer membrane protein TolC
MGCLHTLLGERTTHKTAPSPEVPWRPAPSEVPRYAPSPIPPTIPPDLLESKERLTLTKIVDIALRNSPDTRAAWSDARAAAAALGSKKGAYYPEVDGNGNVSYQKGLAAGGISYELTTYGPTAELNWLLFNFGGREATVEEARQALLAANWTHNSTIQNVVLNVEQAYYQYLSAKALAKAELATVKEAQTNLDAAQERHKVGVGTIADVLQAKTALSQAQLTLETIRGQIQTTRGALATAMGLPANISFDIDLPPEGLPLAHISEEVDHFIEQAQTKRPDLAAARSLASQAEVHVRTVKAVRYPSLLATANIGRTFYENTGSHADTSLAGLQLQIPLFNGFSREYDILKAEGQAEAAKAHLASLEQAVVLQVWTSYYNFKTAEQRVRSSEDLLESAKQSYDVALGRYKAGVGRILDLLSAQGGLENARAERISAYTDLFLSLAQLAHDTGSLWAAAEPFKGTPPSDSETRGTP